MSPVQDSYTAEHIAGFAGQRVDLGLVDIISKVAEGSEINFGLAVIRGTGDDQAKLPSAAGQSFLGVTEYTTAWAANASDIHLYAENREMNILDLGRIRVVTEQSVVPGDPVFYRHTAPGVEVIGAFRKDADGANADQIQGASFESTTGAGGIAIIQLRGEAPAVAPLTLFDDHVALATATSLLTQMTQYDTTAGATTSTLADGFEGQEKTLVMEVDGGDMVLTPANLFDGTTLTFNDVGDTVLLRFVDGSWNVISINGVMVDAIAETLTALGANVISLATELSLFDSTNGAMTGTLADGTEGQIKTMKMTVDGGTDMVVTPVNLHDGATLTFADVNDSMVLQFIGGTWLVISNNGVVIA